VTDRAGPLATGSLRPRRMTCWSRCWSAKPRAARFVRFGAVGAGGPALAAASTPSIGKIQDTPAPGREGARDIQAPNAPTPSARVAGAPPRARRRQRLATSTGDRSSVGRWRRRPIQLRTGRGADRPPPWGRRAGCREAKERIANR